MAINANELRIGNLVLVNDEFIRVENINEDGINQEIESGWYGDWMTEYKGYFEEWWGNKSGTVQPIPITPDILLKCGFEDKNENDPKFLRCYILEPLEYFPPQGEKYKDREGVTIRCHDPYYDINLPHIKYLHQLQNLYFSLTNNELNIEGL